MSTLESRDAHHDILLANLLDDGSRIVRDLANEDGAAIDKAEPYERLARAIRRSIVLSRHIAQNPLKLRQPPSEPKPASPRPSAPPSAPARDPDAESLRPERPERLEDDLADDLEITRRPIHDAIAEIRRDLTLASTPPTRTKPFDLDDSVLEDLEDEVLLRDTIQRRGKTRDG